ncbi:MAG: BamA/TamA family outer membrane protein [Bacteroidales bacterium]|nr:BamA/TamA family outer membrane protein [Bacteroidales bacterium]MBD5223943.1 BamA/TamA family outer membrane protein [Bacteroidales bacterium]
MNKNCVTTYVTWACCMLLVLVGGCSPSRHVPQGKYLLDNVSIHVNDTTGTLSSSAMMNYVRQRPNNRFLHISRLRLGVYNMSGEDSTKWWNKWVRRLGEAPVIYDDIATDADSTQLLRAMNNAGYLHSKVNVVRVPDSLHRKIKLDYQLTPGEPHIIRNIDYQFPNDTIREIIMRDSSRFIVNPGTLLDRNELETQREWISSRLRNKGYWAFSKEFITFNADTTAGSSDVNLTMIVHPPYPQDKRNVNIDTHNSYLIRDIFVVPDFKGTSDFNPSDLNVNDTIQYKDITILTGSKSILRPSVIYDNIFLHKGQIFRQRDVDNTYSAFSRLEILKFIQIRMIPAGKLGNFGLVDAYILLTPGRSQNITLELEGTNSEGDLGVAAGINYSHRNAGHGGEVLSFKVRGSYQAINGHLEGFVHNRFMEYGVEGALTFPKFKAPFINDSFKRKIRASTELHLSLNYQERPEFTRIISTAGWRYIWSEHASRFRYIFTPIDINYVFLPKSTKDFVDQIAPDNPLLRYSYEDHFIMRTGFNFYYTNKRRPSPFSIHSRNDIITVRTQAEVAGNLLFAICRAAYPHRDFHENPYKVFGIRFAQYVRLDSDFSYLHTFDHRNALACYAGFGIGVPYGNSYVLPFEKRFYGGGANGVRGWDVRTLGPGRYPGSNSVNDFMYQCGDIRLNLSAEYRLKLFWVIESGLFIDMGNIWTIRNYATQPYGKFNFNSFYKELAAAYGVGIRLDFNYFLVRLDLGMKAHNPAINQEPWPLIHPRWGRDHSFHFSIGYPF